MLELVKELNGYLWNVILIFLLCGTGIYYTFRLKFIQVRRFGQGLKLVFGHMSFKGKRHDNGSMTTFQSLSTAIAAQVGTGNLAGAATAVMSGGPGAIFWMWMSAFFGMATIYAEASLAQNYKTTVNGEVTGGPVYYIRQAFKGNFGKFLSLFFAVTIILALGFMGNMVQSNSIGAAFAAVFETRGINIPAFAIGVALAILAAFIFIGGTSRLAAFVEKFVPIMAVIYIVGGLALLVANFTQIPEVFKMIIVGAFSPEGVAGGAFGVTVQQAIRYGVARGLFSNEAGMGSTPHAHALAKVDHPGDQGIIAMLGVFIDTFIVLTMTALVIISTSVASGAWMEFDGAELAQVAFNSAFGSFGNIFIAICMLFFAFSTIIGWYFFGEQNVKYLFGKKAVKIYGAIVVLFIVLGSTLKVDLVWNMSDMFNGLMVLPNIIGLLALSGIVVKMAKDYDAKHRLPNNAKK